MHATNTTRNISTEKLVLQCCGCQRNIATICKANNNKCSWTIRAKCPFCIEYSNPINITGEFFYSGYSKYHDQDTQDDIPITILNDIQVDNKILTIILTKA